jgi:predicted NBD/HSP70 family sugar kinase
MAPRRQEAGPPGRDALGQLVEQLHLLGGSATRAELTERLAVGRSVMGYLLGELTERGLVTVDRGGARSRAGEGGRPSHLVRVADSAPVVIAAQLSPDAVSVATVGLGAGIVDRYETRLPSQRAEDALADLCAAIAERLHSGRIVLGVGLAVPSPVRRSDGYAPAALHLGWPGVPLRELMLDRLRERHGVTDVPLVLANDANLAAMAEFRHGAGRGSAQLLYLMTGNVGLGGAVVSEGRLFVGARGYAMEPGHITVDPAGAPCPCGSTGCLEVEADHRGLLRLAGRGEVPLDAVTSAVAEVLAAAESGDAGTRRAVHQVNRNLGTGLADLVNLTDPDRIVLGGTLARLHRLEPDVVRERIAKRSFLRPLGDVPIAPGELPHDVLLGAAELALQPLLDDPRRALDGTARLEPGGIPR